MNATRNNVGKRLEFIPLKSGVGYSRDVPYLIGGVSYGAGISSLN
jgi:hypothetical protein